MLLKQALFILIIAISTISSLLFNQSGLIRGFLKEKYCERCTFFGCTKNKRDVINLFKTVPEVGLNYYNFDRLDLPEINFILYRFRNHMALFVDGDCPNISKFLQKCGVHNNFFTVMHWLIITRNPNFSTFFDQVDLYINADIKVALMESGKEPDIAIFDVYNPSTKHGGELKIRRLGHYNEVDGYKARNIFNMYWSRKNMTGVTFKTAVVIPKEFNLTVEEYLANDSHVEYNSMHRMQAVTVGYCRDFYNFTLDMRKVDSWGYVIPNSGGTFDGMVGMLQRREIDFGGSPLICKYDRLPVLDYSYGNWILRAVFIFQPPKSTASSFQIFVRPLSYDVWASAFLATVITIIFIKMALVTEKKWVKESSSAIDSKWSFAFITTFGAFCQQGSSYNPFLLSGRIVTVLIFVLYVLLYQFYSGFIVSYLLMDPPRTINDLNDLLHSTLDTVVEDILIDHAYFVQTTDPIAIELYKTKVKRGNRSGYYPPEEGLEMVKQGGTAFHVETSTAYPIIKKTFPPATICKLQEVEMYSKQPMHTNAQRYSPFREMLNYCMLRIAESGVLSRLRSHWDAPRPGCIPSDFEKKITVGLEEFYCAHVFLLIGIVFGFIFLLCERHTHSKQNQVKTVKM